MTGRPDDVEPAPQPLTFTPEALGTLCATVGSRPAETGAKLFGPVSTFGVDLVEFDERGSAAAGGTVYAPDVEWAEERIRHWIGRPGEEQRIWTGDAHSHPGDLSRPSAKAGPGQGDLGYVEAVFEANEIQFEFAIPILTRTEDPTVAVRISPWVVLRSDPSRARWARLEVQPSAAFPTREFGPAIRSGHDGTASSSLDLDLVAALLGRPVHWSDDGRTLQVDATHGPIEVAFGDDGQPRWAHLVEGPLSRTLGLVLPDDETTMAEIRTAELAQLAIDADAGRRASAHPITAGPTDPTDPTRLVDTASPSGTETESGSPGFTRAAYYARSTSLLSPEFHDRSILVVGASGGSYLIEKLARLGPRRIVVVDPDVVEVANLTRTAFRIAHLGRPKPEAMAELIAEANPFVEVDAHDADVLRMSSADIDDLLEGIDLIVAGTDSFEAQAELNRWSQRAGIPAVFIAVHEGALGGVVHWTIPGQTACFRCMVPGRYAAAAAGEHDDHEVDPVDLPGAVGLLTDVQAIDMAAAALIVGLLERGVDSPKGRLIEQLGDCTELVVTCDPAYPWGRELFAGLTSDLPATDDPAQDLGTYLGVLPQITLPWTPDPSCPDCALHQPTPDGLAANPSDRHEDPS